MFSKRIIESARFLKMPISSQALYFHLGIEADDDGVVEAWGVLKSVGCTEDDLRVLASKGFIRVLNEDLVTYILDWNENNQIRPDRKIDSIYKDLLISMNPDIKLIEKRPRADRKTKVIEEMDNHGTTMGQPTDGIGKVRLGKDSLGEDRLGEEEPRPQKPKKHTYGEYKHVRLTDEEYNRLCDEFGEVKTTMAINKVDAYCQETGKTYKDYNLTIRRWGFDSPKGSAKQPIDWSKV
jgi:hypothetical protein